MLTCGLVSRLARPHLRPTLRSRSLARLLRLRDSGAPYGGRGLRGTYLDRWCSAGLLCWEIDTQRGKSAAFAATIRAARDMSCVRRQCRMTGSNVLDTDENEFDDPFRSLMRAASPRVAEENERTRGLLREVADNIRGANSDRPRRRFNIAAAVTVPFLVLGSASAAYAATGGWS